MSDEHEHDHEHDHDEHEHHHHDGPHDYVGAIQGYRAEKDAFFKDSANSPVPPEERAAFEGLPYYPVNVDLVFEGLALEPYTGDEPANFEIPTSDNKLRPAHRAGTFSFEIDGLPLRLTAYEIDGGHEDNSVFVPFLDATSGKETYGAGRYLLDTVKGADLGGDVDLTTGRGTLVVDLNFAYNPSCAYDPAWACPLAPPGNIVPVPLRVGELYPVREPAGD
jgi:uncharacterized protein (DUF1684 family)